MVWEKTPFSDALKALSEFQDARTQTQEKYVYIYIIKGLRNTSLVPEDTVAEFCKGPGKQDEP